jgi:ferredoxin-nitrate reductase
MDLRDQDGAPLVKWSTPEEAWTAFAASTKDRPCDQSALTYGNCAAAAASSGR